MCQILAGSPNFAIMANSRLGDRRRLGRALPQHQLMQSLLGGFVRGDKVTKGTQTAASECCCARWRHQNGGDLVKRRVVSLEANMRDRRLSRSHQNLMASIRERVQEEECCECSDGWSDNSVGDGDGVAFPKETRNAMSMLMFRPPAPPLRRTRPQSAWPGVAERMDHDAEERLMNAGEMVAKIKKRLSKNKLDMN